MGLHRVEPDVEGLDQGLLWTRGGLLNVVDDGVGGVGSRDGDSGLSWHLDGWWLKVLMSEVDGRVVEMGVGVGRTLVMRRNLMTLRALG